MDGTYPNERIILIDSTCVLYADQLYYNLEQGWYHFRCSCFITSPWDTQGTIISLSEGLRKYTGMSPRCSVDPACEYMIREFLMHKDGCNLSTCFQDEDDKMYVEESILKLIRQIATLYHRMIHGEGMLLIMKECMDT